MKKADSVQRFLDRGLTLVGGAAGGATGAIIARYLGGIPGTILGSAFGAMAKDVVADFAKRFLSQQEYDRVASAAVFAIRRIEKNLAEGKQLRQDSLLLVIDGRSAAQEIFEGVLLKCKNEFETRKQNALANVFGNILFMPGISASSANFFLGLAEAVTYSQLCLLALVERCREIPFETVRLQSPNGELSEATALRCQVEGLMSEGRRLLTHNGLPPSLQTTDYFLSDMGRQFYRLLGLDEIPKEELVALANKFGGIQPTRKKKAPGIA